MPVLCSLLDTIQGQKIQYWTPWNNATYTVHSNISSMDCIDLKVERIQCMYICAITSDYGLQHSVHVGGNHTYTKL